MRRSFGSWIGDVLCGLLAYTLSRWLWKERSDGVFAHLPAELATFVGTYVLLKLVLKMAGVARRNAKAAKALRAGKDGS